MKRILTLSAAIIAGFSAFNAVAQESTQKKTDSSTLEYPGERWAAEWKYAFSKEGIKEWKPEFTLRYQLGIHTSGAMLSGGVRFDEKRTLSLFVSHFNPHLDYAPGDLYIIGTGINFRRYWHFGKRKIFALYSDLYAGAGWIYKITGKYSYRDTETEPVEVIKDNVGDITFIGGWQPGVRIRCYRNLHIFFGPVFATDCLGGHVGIGF